MIYSLFRNEVNYMNKEIEELLKGMSFEELLSLSEKIRSQIAKEKYDDEVKHHDAETVCPRCSSKNIKKVGYNHQCHKQGYQCKECSRKFFSTCNTLTHATKKPIGCWITAIECILNHDTLSQMAEKCGIHKTTAFYWRHKILDRIKDLVNTDILSDVVYLDETLVPITFEEKDKSIPEKRGISENKINIACAIDIHNHIRCIVSERGRITTASLIEIYKSHIMSHTTIVSDSLRSYHEFMRVMKAEWIKIPSKKTECNGYTLERVNELHSCIKHFLYNYRGVGSKYLQNYISLFMLQWNNTYVATQTNVFLLFTKLLFNCKVTRNRMYNKENRNLSHECVIG